MKFELSDDAAIINADSKLLDINYYKGQFGLLMKPCTQMVEKVEQEFKICLERMPKVQRIEPMAPDLSNKRQIKKKSKKKPKKEELEDDEDFLLE